MAAKLTVSVTSSNARSTVRISTSGRYKDLLTNGINLFVPAQPLYTTATAKAFWTAVLAEVQAEIAALP